MAKNYGLLGDPFDWDSLTPEEAERIYYFNNPDEAYKRIRFLEAYSAQLNKSADVAHRIAEGAINAIAKGGTKRRELEKLAEIERRRRAALDSKAATAANAERAKEFEATLAKFVLDRLSQQSHLTPKQIVAEVLPKAWAKKNKAGDPYTFEYLRDKISPLVTAAKTKLRAVRK